FFPSYFVTAVVRKKVLDKHPKLATYLNNIAAKLDTPTMTELNRRVDIDHESIEKVARDFLKQQGLLPRIFWITLLQNGRLFWSLGRRSCHYYWRLSGSTDGTLTLECPTGSVTCHSDINSSFQRSIRIYDSYFFQIWSRTWERTGHYCGFSPLTSSNLDQHLH